MANGHGPSSKRAPTPEICLEDHYAAAALIGLLAAQHSEPPIEWAQEWALTIGEKMAREAKRRRRRQR